MCEDPIFNLEDKYFLSREEAFERATEKSVHYLKVSKELNLDNLEKNLLKRFESSLASAAPPIEDREDLVTPLYCSIFLYLNHNKYRGLPIFNGEGEGFLHARLV